MFLVVECREREFIDIGSENNSPDFKLLIHFCYNLCSKSFAEIKNRSIFAPLKTTV